MKITKEELERIRPAISDWFSNELIEKLFELFPDAMGSEAIAATIVESLSTLPEGIPDEDIINVAKTKMEGVAKGPKDSKKSDARVITRNYYDSLLLEMRLMGTKQPETSIELFGEKFDSPVMTAAVSHLGKYNPNQDSMMDYYARAAAKMNTLHWVGMCDNEWFEKIMGNGAKTVRIVKPYADEEKIISQLRFAEDAGAIAVGMDIDHTFTEKGEVDVIMGEAMSVKSLEDMKRYVEITKLPFIVKGVLSVSDALKCKEIGAAGIVVSHHSGRLPFAVPPVMLLPEIRKAVGDSMKIFVDCGVSSGFDAYKAMALGADAVSVGNHLIPYLRQGGENACADRMKAMTEELRGAMAYTGVEDCQSFEPTVIHTVKNSFL